MTNAAVSIDWLSFTVPSHLTEPFLGQFGLDVEAALQHLGMPVLAIEQRGGLHGYLRGATFDGFGGAFALWDGESQRGSLHIQLSGKALGFYELVRHFDVGVFIASILELGCSVTRLDIAADDFTGCLTLGRFLAASQNGDVVSRFANKRNPEYIGPSSLDDNGAWSLYYGTRRGHSETLVNVYNKAAESGVDAQHWVRVEARFRGDKAQAVALSLSASGFSAPAMLGVLRGVLDFRQHNDDVGHCNRWDMLPWWASFVGNCDVVHPGKAHVEKQKNVGDYYEFLRRQASAALSIVNDFYGEGAISELVALGRERRGASHDSAVRASLAMGDVFDNVIAKPLPEPLDKNGLKMLAERVAKRDKTPV